MFDFTPSQRRIIAAGATVLAFAIVLAFVLFVGWAVLKCLGFASAALTPVIAGIFLSMLFKPYYEWIRGLVHNASLAVALMFASIVVPFGIISWFCGAFIVDQAMHLVRAAPTIVARLSEWVNANYPNAQALLTQFGAKPDDLLPMLLMDPAKFSQELISMLGSEYGADAMRAGVGFLKSLSGIGSALLSLVFFVFFLTRPAMTGRDYVRELAFLKVETSGFIARQIDAFFDILINFFRRQVVICLIEGVLYGVGFTLVNLPYGFVLGFLLGVLNLVPFLGSVTCLPLALPIAYFGDGGSVLRLVLVALVWLTGQILDGYFITPKIQGDRTGLGYAGVIFSFIFWGVVFHSMLGLLLAIPLSAFCVVLWRALKEKYIKGVI
ncbi:MAG: AI-2E family transporter [Kiritimatiellia bacterium]